MISRLKRKVIVLTTISLLALLILIVSGMNIISFASLINESDEILNLISDSGGKFPEIRDGMPERQDVNGQMPKELERRFSPELQFETRFFSVVLTASGDTVRTDTGKIAAVDTTEAVEYAEKALSSGKEKGFIDNYRYLIKNEDENRLITFLDCTRKLDSFRTFLYASIIVSLLGFIVISVIIIIISGKIIRPIAESYEKQKRFITDASHELRTPLAIINANIDVIEDEVKDTESIEDIRNQTERLRNLTEDLVTLSRMEEGNAPIVKSMFSATDIIADISLGFKPLANGKGINLNVLNEQGVELNGDKKAFSKLVSILLDNAVKYTPSGESIDFELKTQGKSAVIICKNTTENEMSKENTAHVFDRFYRTDASRNSSTGGHGIGLSIAKAIAEAHGGKISAAAPDTHTFIITATLPL